MNSSVQRPEYDERPNRPWNSRNIRSERVINISGIPRLEWRQSADMLAMTPDVAMSVAELWLRHAASDSTPSLHLPRSEYLLPTGKTLIAQLGGHYVLKNYGPSHLDPEIGLQRPTLRKLISEKWWNSWFTQHETPTNVPEEVRSVVEALLNESLSVLGSPQPHIPSPNFINRLSHELRWIICMMSRAQKRSVEWFWERCKDTPALQALQVKISHPGMNLIRLRLRPEGEPDNMTLAAVINGTAHLFSYGDDPGSSAITVLHGRLQRHETARLRMGILSCLIDAAGSEEALRELSLPPHDWESESIARLPFHSVIIHRPRQRQSMMIACESLIPRTDQLDWTEHLSGLPRDRNDLHFTDPRDPTPLVALQVMNSHIKQLAMDSPDRRALYDLKNASLMTLYQLGLVVRAENDSSRSEFEGVMAGLSEMGAHSFHLQPEFVLGIPKSEQGQSILKTIFESSEMRDRSEWIRSLISHVPLKCAVQALEKLNLDTEAAGR